MSKLTRAMYMRGHFQNEKGTNTLRHLEIPYADMLNDIPDAGDSAFRRLPACTDA